MVQMTVSDQIIAVLNDLCAKFGLAIDWSAENVVPYIQDVCSRLVRYEVLTSIAVCVVFASVLGVMYGMWQYFEKRAQKELEKRSYSGYSESAMFFQVVFWIFVFVYIIILSCQIFDIIGCLTIPEKMIFEYVSSILNSAG